MSYAISLVFNGYSFEVMAIMEWILFLVTLKEWWRTMAWSALVLCLYSKISVGFLSLEEGCCFSRCIKHVPHEQASIQVSMSLKKI